MADRSVSVDLIARVSGFVAGIRTAQAATRGFVTDLEKSVKKQQALRELGNAAGVMGVVASAAFIGVVKSAADFDQAMSRVQAATHESSSNMDLLRQAALEAGKTTVFSATESADAVTALSKAGVSAGDILGGGLGGALSLASAGELEVAQAAEIAATAMTQFGLSGKDVPHIADLLAAAAGKAQGEVTDMAQALKYVGPVAHSMGVSIEETTGTIAELASQGILGSQAGTSMRGMLTALTSPSKQASDTMKQLGINMYDANGQFVGFTGIAGQLHAQMKGLTNAERDEALGRIFGNQQITAARILYEQGAAGVEKWTKAVDDQGYAAETAAIKLDNLKGDLEQLRGALETAFIGTGDAAQGPLRELVQMVTGLVNAYNELPGPVKTGALALTGLTGVIGLGTFAASRMIGAYVDLRTNMQTLGLSSKTAEGQVSALSGKMIALRGGAAAAGAGLLILGASLDDSQSELKAFTSVASGALMGFAVTGGPWGAAIGAGIGLLTAFAQHNAAAAADVKALTATLDEQTGAITENSFKWAANKLISEDLVGDATALGLSAKDVTNAMLDQGNAADVLSSRLRAIISDNQEYHVAGRGTAAVDNEKARAARDLLGIIGDTSGTLAKSRSEWEFTKEAEKAAGDAAKEAGDKTSGMGDDMGDAASKAKKLTSAILQLDSAMLNQRGTARDYRSAILDARDALKENGKGLDMNTRKGIENNAMLDGIASAALAAATAENKHGRVVVTNRRLLEEARGTLIAMAQSFGMTASEARKYANEVLRIPSKANTDVNINTSGALAQLSTVQRYLAGLHDKTITVNVNTGAIGHIKDGGLIGAQRFDSGGSVHGPGGPRDDKVPAWLSAGEFVVNAYATARNLPLLHAINAQRFADGGEVTASDLRALIFQVRHFNVRPGDSASDVRGAVSDLLDDLRTVLGKDSAIVKHVARLGDRMVGLERAQDRASARFDRASDRLDSIKQAERQYASEVMAAYTHDYFSESSMAESDLQFRADRNDARRASKDLRRIRHRGIGGALFRELAASGNTALLDELAHSSRRELRDYASNFMAARRTTRQLGQQAGMAVYGKEIREQTKVMRHVDRTMDRLNRRIEHLENDIYRGSSRGIRDGMNDRNRRTAASRATR